MKYYPDTGRFQSVAAVSVAVGKVSEMSNASQQRKLQINEIFKKIRSCKELV